jgi:heat shock protein HslJ
MGLAACTGKTETITLEDTTWVLESYGEQGNLQAVLEDTEITAVFDSAEDKVTGSAGCNSYFAGYEIENNELSISAIGSTEMYCEGLMEQEQQYLSILGGAENFQVQDSQLRISSSGNQVLIFHAR